jgi:hypothetical protein
MRDKKQEYVKPVLTQLTYTADVHVAAGGFCKGETGTGSKDNPCVINLNCDDIGS